MWLNKFFPNNTKRPACLLILTALFLSPTSASFADNEKHNNAFSFFVAGHTYGEHRGKNIGLYPKFLKHLQQATRPDFIVFTGDIVRKSTADAWSAVLKELQDLGLTAFFVMGNHDDSPLGRSVFHKMFQSTYYNFTKANAAFIILDTRAHNGRIPQEQLRLIKNTIDGHPECDHVFIFVHELIWTTKNPKYRFVNHNVGAYRNLDTNFWNQLYPLLQAHTHKKFYIIAGDVGGNPGKIPAYYEKRGHIMMLASGMGEVQDENYLRVSVNQKEVTFQLIPLNKKNTLEDITAYDLKWMKKNFGR